MTYTHLLNPFLDTQDERYQIAILLKAGHKQSDIARIMNRPPSTISRELCRNRGQHGYRPKQAHEFSQARMRACENGCRVCSETWAFAEAKLGELWSPEQISGHLKANGQPGISHETIYQRIYADRRGTIPNQVSIDQRPAIVDSRQRFGDWEADLVIGAGHRQALVTLNERKSRYALFAHVSTKTAEVVSDAMISLLAPFSACVHTLTTDNGKAFAGHERIAKTLDAVQKRIQNFFFALILMPHGRVAPTKT